MTHRAWAAALETEFRALVLRAGFFLIISTGLAAFHMILAFSLALAIHAERLTWAITFCHGTKGYHAHSTITTVFFALRSAGFWAFTFLTTLTDFLTICLTIHTIRFAENLTFFFKLSSEHHTHVAHSTFTTFLLALFRTGLWATFFFIATIALVLAVLLAPSFFAERFTWIITLFSFLFSLFSLLFWFLG